MSDIKKILETGEKDPQKPADNSAEINSTNAKLTDLEKQQEADRKKIADLEFSNSLNVVEKQYPHAAEFKDKIREKVDKGYSVADATVSVLNAEGKLKTAADITKENDESNRTGGTSPTIHPTSKKEKTAEEYAQDLRDLEAKGELKIT